MIGLIITTEMQRQAYAPTFFSGCNTVLMHVTTAATADQVMVKRDASNEYCGRACVLTVMNPQLLA